MGKGTRFPVTSFFSGEFFFGKDRLGRAVCFGFHGVEALPPLPQGGPQKGVHLGAVRTMDLRLNSLSPLISTGCSFFSGKDPVFL